MPQGPLYPPLATICRAKMVSSGCRKEVLLGWALGSSTPPSTAGHRASEVASSGKEVLLPPHDTSSLLVPGCHSTWAPGGQKYCRALFDGSPLQRPVTPSACLFCPGAYLLQCMGSKQAEQRISLLLLKPFYPPAHWAY